MVRVKSTDLDLEYDDESVLVGQDLKAWGEAEEQELKKSKQNQALWQGLLALAGAGAAIGGTVSHNNTVTAAGFGTMGAGYLLSKSGSRLDTKEYWSLIKQLRLPIYK